MAAAVPQMARREARASVNVPRHRFSWHESGAWSRTPARAAPQGRYPGGGGSRRWQTPGRAIAIARPGTEEQRPCAPRDRARDAAGCGPARTRPARPAPGGAGRAELALVDPQQLAGRVVQRQACARGSRSARIFEQPLAELRRRPCARFPVYRGRLIARMVPRRSRARRDSARVPLRSGQLTYTCHIHVPRTAQRPAICAATSCCRRSSSRSLPRYAEFTSRARRFDPRGGGALRRGGAGADQRARRHARRAVSTTAGCRCRRNFALPTRNSSLPAGRS